MDQGETKKRFNRSIPFGQGEKKHKKRSISRDKLQILPVAPVPEVVGRKGFLLLELKSWGRGSSTRPGITIGNVVVSMGVSS